MWTGVAERAQESADLRLQARLWHVACGEPMEAALYLRCLLLSFQQGHLVPEAEAGEFQEMHLCTDCKSLYDHLHREGVPKAPTERRLAIDLAAIRQSLKTEAIHQWKRRYGIGAVRPDKPCKPPLHWVPTEEQLADILTKKMNPAQWWSAVRDGRLKLPFTLPNARKSGMDS